jgi:hypothetical protein
MHRFLPLLLVVAACAVEPVDIEESQLAAGHTVDVLVPLAGSPTAIVQDGGTLFWIDRNDATLVKMPAGGGVTTVLATGAQALAPWTLAADATHVYWWDGAAIQRTPRAGGVSTTLAAASEVYGIAVQGSYVYWTGENAVHRALRTGGSAKVIATGSTPSPLVVDSFFVFYADAHVLGGSNEIVRIPNGGGAKVVLSKNEDALGLVGDASGLVWKRFWTGDVRKGSKYMPGATTITDSGGGWGDLAITAADVWWTTGPVLHRVSRSGGAREEVYTAPEWANSVAIDGSYIYLAVDAPYEGDPDGGQIIRVHL